MKCEILLSSFSPYSTGKHANKSTYILKFSKQDALFSFYLSVILDCLGFPIVGEHGGGILPFYNFFRNPTPSKPMPLIRKTTRPPSPPH